jgi:hypothetical protein
MKPHRHWLTVSKVGEAPRRGTSLALSIFCFALASGIAAYWWGC